MPKIGLLIAPLILIIIAFAFLAIPVPYVAGQTDPLKDHSGNEINLTDFDSVTFDGPATNKYGTGASQDTNCCINALEYRDNSVCCVLYGDISIFIAFQLDSYPVPDAFCGCTATTAQTGLIVQSHEPVAGVEAANENAAFALFVRGDGKLGYIHEFGTGSNQLMLSTLAVSLATPHTVTLTRNTATNTVLVKLDGTEYINYVYTTPPTGGEITTFRVFSEVPSGTMAPNYGPRMAIGTIYEARLWDMLVDSTTLAQIADPLEPLYENMAEGNELGWWKFESEPIIANAIPGWVWVIPTIALVGIIVVIVSESRRGKSNA